MKFEIKKSKRFAWITLVLVVLITVFFFYEMKEKAYMETNLDEYMPKDNPAFVYSDKAEEWFNIKDGILIAIENEDGIYNPKTLQKVKDITKALQDMEEFEDLDVMSLYTADNIVGDDGSLDVKAFYKRVPKTQEKLDKLRENVRSNDMVYGRLVSKDEKVALIVAGMNDSTFTQEFYHRLVKLAKSYEGDGDKIYIAGRPIVEGSLAQLAPQDMKRMVPLVLVVIALVLYFLLRSVRAATATLVSVFFSSIWAFGLMAALNIPIYSVSTMIPVMLIAIGVAYGIYFYNNLNLYFRRNKNATKIDGINHVIKVLTKPLFMAAFTTIAGFTSLLTSQVYPIKYFGLFTAFGIFVSFVLALTFLPAIVIIFGYKPRGKEEDTTISYSPRSKKLTDKLIAHKKLIIVSTIVIIIVSVIGMTKVWINSSFLDKFEKNSEIVKTDAFVNEHFGGTSTLNVILESNEKDAFKNPKNLALMDKMQKETEKLPKVGSSFSLADYIKRMNKVMNADKEEYYTIPDNQNMIAQYLLLYEMSGDPENLLRVTNYDYSRTNITFQLKGDDSKTINSAIDVIEKYRKDFEANGITINYAGSGYKALVFSDLILEGQIYSILLSLAFVLILLTVMFKSYKAGLIGSVPIIVTGLINFGVMGWLNIPLSTTTALLSSIAIGIGIDYAIHFIENYKQNLKKTGNIKEAIYITMGLTGKAISYNAIVVISGFLVLLFSVFPPNRALGSLVSLNMFTSFVGTLTIMMVLIYTSKLFVKKDNLKNDESKNLDKNENPKNKEKVEPVLVEKS